MTSNYRYIELRIIAQGKLPEQTLCLPFSHSSEAQMDLFQDKNVSQSQEKHHMTHRDKELIRAYQNMQWFNQFTVNKSSKFNEVCIT